MDTPSPRPKRRPRYSGRNPRRFDQKYKELDPEKYPETLQKVLDSGKTPAGMHRPVLVAEVLQVLKPAPGEFAVDATLGYGGHAGELLKALQPGGTLLALDTDPIELPRTEARLRAAGASAEALRVVQSNFAGLPRILGALGIPGADLILADLGCSSMQFDNPERGFSFKLEGPLDLRMNPNKGRPASAWLASLKEPELREILIENSDEPHASLLAGAVIRAQALKPLDTTSALARVLKGALQTLPPQIREQEGNTPLRRFFQALRIAVNEEFTALEMFLRALPGCLKAGGRVAILTFHSGEDRRVKKAFQAGLREGSYAEVADNVIRPSEEEIRSNPRASSAKLRWAIRSAEVPE
ncbi:MAG TPA: 16S rRNA (cytosine(1402)-N(4))-methyltransferase RsmH [Candidatus Saccharimonadales bacterium]|nr:16S rRNA (cytosine(1402)-N(4))-methyltransferase RsmH [Candidatus Saccharimonadales bacterium]